jgi:hypothetical protein
MDKLSFIIVFFVQPYLFTEEIKWIHESQSIFVHNKQNLLYFCCLSKLHATFPATLLYKLLIAVLTMLC